MAVDTRHPTGEGTHTGFTASAGTKWACVDDLVVAYNDDTDYVSRADSNGRQSFTFTAYALPNPAIVDEAIGVVVIIRALMTSGAATIAGGLRIGGVDYDAVAQATLGIGRYRFYIFRWTTDPSTTVAWTRAGVNAIQEIGVIAAGMTAGETMRVTQLYTHAGYRPVTPNGVCIVDTTACLLPMWNAIVDSNGDEWTFGAAGITLRNGTHMGFGAGQAYYYVNDMLHIEGFESPPHWYEWTGAAWGDIGTQPPLPVGAISIPVGTNAQAVVTGAPVGATFLFLRTDISGVNSTHRHQKVFPKADQTFLCAPHAVLSGAKVLTGAIPGTGNWAYTNQTQQGFQDSDQYLCESPRCGCPEELYIDDVLKEHVDSFDLLGPGKWFFNYSGNILYIGDDPTGHVVEATVTDAAFVPNFVSGVTIRNHIIEKYAVPSNMSACDTYVGWVVEFSEFRWNHNAAVRSGGGDIIRSNWLHHNGGYAVLGSGGDILVEDNEISWNNTARYNIYWGCVTKWVWTTRLTVRGNISHDNYGQGLWTDINNIETLYEYNAVYNNYLDGIFHELSYKALIRFNSVHINGFGSAFQSALAGAGINVSDSPNVDVHNNSVVNNLNGIVGVQTTRALINGPYGFYRVENLQVYNNLVTMTVGYSGIHDYVAGDAVFTTQNNLWVNNTYQFGPASAYFGWLGLFITYAAWQTTYGQDLTGTFTPSANGFKVPDDGATITDSTGAVWSLGGGGETLRDGLHEGGGYGQTLLWLDGQIYIEGFEVDSIWYRWTGVFWENVGTTEPGALVTGLLIKIIPVLVGP